MSANGRDDLNDEELPEDLHRLLRGARPGRPVPSHVRDELWERLARGTLLGGSGGGDPPKPAGAEGGSASPPEAPPRGGVPHSSPLAKTAALLSTKAAIGTTGLLIGIGLGAAGHARWSSGTTALPASISAAPVSLAPPFASSAPLPEPAPLAPSSAALAAAPPSSSSIRPLTSARAEAAPGPGRDEQLAAERSLIDIARTATGRGQGAAAIAALERHVREFPRGRLTEEREGLWIQALLVAGRRGEAEERLARFRRSFPRSMMLPALEAAVGR